MLTVTPSLGMAVIFENGGIASGGMSALLEVDLSRAWLRWGAFAAVRGIGVGCANGCDLGGRAIGLGVSVVLRGVGVGGGVGLLNRSEAWHVQPHGQLSVGRRRLRAQVRIEIPEDTDGVHVPFLLGFRIPVG
jgi:hypothetical protein